jgi:Domain of unknown function (DUF5666)
MTEQTEPAPSTFQGRVRGPNPLRPIAMLVATLVVLVGAAAAIGASPTSSPGPGASASPEASPDANGTWDARDHWMFPPGGGLGPIFGGGRFGFHRMGAISITAISGSEVSLETVNGWRRTISVTDEVTITKGGEEITLADLAVGDRVALREVRTDDSEFRVTHLVVLLPTAAGEVTAIGDSSITIRGFDGETTTIHVDSETSYRVAGQDDGSLADIEVGMALIAQGTERADGSLDADRVRAGNPWHGPGRDRMKFPWPRGPWEVEPSPAPDASAETSVG